MAQPRQRRTEQPERQAEQVNNLINNLKQMAEQLRNLQVSPEQMERIRSALEQVQNALRAHEGAHGGPAQRPSTQRVPAPRRIHNYDVTIGAGPMAVTYRVTLQNPLPAGRESQELLRMAGRHEFFESGPSGPERVTTSGQPAARAEVMMVAGPDPARYNARPNMARVDNFEVALNRAGESGTPVLVAASPSPQTRRGG